MSKAFDSINQSISLQKTKSPWAGPIGSPLVWQLLIQRFQRVRINAALSEALPVTCEVSQGGVLGTLLFGIYINNLSAVSETCSSACYIDDTKLILSFTVEEFHTTAVKINDDLQLIRDWCFENYLLLNLDDTKLMVFSSPQTICKPLSFKFSFLGKEHLLRKNTDSIKGLWPLLHKRQH